MGRRLRWADESSARRTTYASLAPLVLAFALFPVAGARADVVRDGRVGSAGPGAVATEAGSNGGLRYLIRESDGQRAGQNLFHSFSRMDLTSNETAVYQGSPDIRNLVTTITGGRSSIDGKIQSDIAGANLFLINPDGVVFGEHATVDLSGALTVSTAQQLIFSNGDRMATSGGPPAILSVADPVGFGFLDTPAAISIEGSRIELVRDPPLSLAGGDISLIGGDISLLGGRSDGETALVSTQSGRLNLVSLASAGEVILTPDGVLIDGSPRFGDLTIADEISVTTSGIPREPIAGFFDVPGFGSGPVFVRAADFLIRDAELRTLTVTKHDAGNIDIGLTGALTIESVRSNQTSGIFADTGFRQKLAPGQVVTIPSVLIQGWGDVTVVEGDACGAEVCGIRYIASGDAGDVRIRATDVRLLNGGKITATSEFDGNAGTIDIAFENEMEVSGRRGPGDASLLTTNANGTGNPGTIRIHSDRGALQLDDFGALIIQNGVESLANGFPGQIHVDVASLEMSGNARIDSSTRGAGPGGILDITARDGMTLSGRTDAETFTGISTLSQPGSAGQAGSIRVVTSNLAMSDGAEISARPVDATSLGAAGNLRFEIGDQLVMRDATISTQSPNAAGGNIEIGVSGLVNMLNSSITTSVTSGPETGGNITIQPGPESLVLDHSQIIARADAGAGGRIDIEAGVVITDTSSAIDASSATGIDGVVLINGIEGNIVPEVAQLATPSVDASSFVREPCAARRPGASNRFVIDERERISVDADDYLNAPMSALLVATDPDRTAGGEQALAALESAAAISAAARAQANDSPPSSCSF